MLAAGADARSTPQPDAPAEGFRASLSRLARKPTMRVVLVVYITLAVLLLAGRFVSPAFSSPDFIWVILSLGTFVAVAAFGQGIVVLTGGLDLSIPNVIAFSGVLLTGLSMGEDARLATALFAVVAAGAGVGLINGLGVVKLNISPVIMTLATNVMLAGVVLVFTAGTPRGSSPPMVRQFVLRSLGPIPWTVLFLVVFTAGCIILMNATVLARQLYAIGLNKEAARLSGVPVQVVTVAAYVLSGLAAALTGVLLVGQGGSSYLGMGDAYLLLSLGAVVIGGASIGGGRGHYLGTLGGAMLLTTTSVFLASTTLPSATRQIVFAAIIVVAVLLSRKYQ